MSETQITAAMVKAGVAALEDFSGAYGHEQLVAAVYSAMVAAAPVEKSGASLSASKHPRLREPAEARS